MQDILSLSLALQNFAGLLYSEKSAGREAFFGYWPKPGAQENGKTLLSSVESSLMFANRRRLRMLSGASTLALGQSMEIFGVTLSTYRNL